MKRNVVKIIHGNIKRNKSIEFKNKQKDRKEKERERGKYWWNQTQERRGGSMFVKTKCYKKDY